MSSKKKTTSQELKKALKWAVCQAATMEAFYAGTLTARQLAAYHAKLIKAQELLNESKTNKRTAGAAARDQAARIGQRNYVG